MKPLYLAAASALALTAAACGPKVPVARAALDCPPTQGDLTRTSASPDGKACTYVNDGGAEVTLQLVNVTGSPDATLAAIETSLLADRTVPAPEGEAKGEKTDAGPKAGDAAAKAAREAAEDTKGVTVQVKVDTHGDTGIVTEEGGTTRVNLPGIRVVANDANDTANVKVGPITIDAGDDGATVRMRRDVRLRGEALNRDKRGLRAMFIYTGDDLPQGYRFVGYEAGGPKAGPITVAVVKSKSEGPDGGDLYPDVKRLVRKNGGV